MYKELIKIKGTNLTVKEFKEKADALDVYEKGFFDDFFNDDVSENENVLVAAKGWAEEKGGYTVWFAEEA